YAVCHQLRNDPATRLLPVVMITASSEAEKVRAIEAGADDFISKPFNQSELLARVKSLVRVKAYYDTIQSQAAELAEWNRSLESRVQQQVEELERLGRLRRFLSPQLAELIVSSGDVSLLKSHRSEISVLFCDLRGFTAFAETAEPEELMGILHEYQEAMGALIHLYKGTVADIAGDGLMVFFNDPMPIPEHAKHAIQMAVAMRQRMDVLIAAWQKRGHTLGFGVGLAVGYATLGQIGFEGRFDYGAIGSVTNLASRLCGEARAGQILVTPRAYAAAEAVVRADCIGDVSLKGFLKPVTVYNILELRGEAAPL
ncbi:MAG TPA: adenylate/guanylate cyclase domain-containing protein, partial [Anaerolineales bacterium]